MRNLSKMTKAELLNVRLKQRVAELETEGIEFKLLDAIASKRRKI